MTIAPVESDPALVPAFRAAREMCRAHGSSFYFASFFLPRRKRDAAYAVYAFCRMIDDAIDVPDSALVGARILREHPVIAGKRTLSQLPPENAGENAGESCGGDTLDLRLSLLRDKLDEIYDGRLELPAVSSRSPQQHALAALQHTVHAFEIDKQYFINVAEGCRMDLRINRYASWDQLENYCYHVAGVVGLIMSCVFGLTHSDAKQQAITMGNAMELTRVLRDVKEDFARGRIYLPRDEMDRFGVGERDLANGTVNDNFIELMSFQIARARRLYRDGAEGVCWLAGDGSRLTASAMAAIDAGILDAIERQRYDVFTRRAHLTTAQKFRRLPIAWKLARRLPDEPLLDVF